MLKSFSKVYTPKHSLGARNNYNMYFHENHGNEETSEYKRVNQKTK